MRSAWCVCVCVCVLVSLSSGLPVSNFERHGQLSKYLVTAFEIGGYP